MTSFLKQLCCSVRNKKPLLGLNIVCRGYVKTGAMGAIAPINFEKEGQIVPINFRVKNHISTHGLKLLVISLYALTTSLTSKSRRIQIHGEQA